METNSKFFIEGTAARNLYGHDIESCGYRALNSEDFRVIGVPPTSATPASCGLHARPTLRNDIAIALDALDLSGMVGNFKYGSAAGLGLRRLTNHQAIAASLAVVALALLAVVL